MLIWTQNGWIPYSKMPPQRSDFYNVTIENFKTKERYTTREFYQDGWHNMTNKNFRVIAWQEQPEPYKGVK